MTRDPRFVDKAGRRRGLLRRADYVTQVQIGLGRAMTRDEYKRALRARLDHVSPATFLAAIKIDIDIASEAPFDPTQDARDYESRMTRGEE